MESLPEDSKRVQFVGLRSVFADPEVRRRLACGQIRPEGRRELWKLEQQRQMAGLARFPGRTQRTIGTADGLSRDYTWGPREYTVLMDPADIRRLFALDGRFRTAFVVLDDLVTLGRNNRLSAGEDRTDGRHATV